MKLSYLCPFITKQGIILSYTQNLKTKIFLYLSKVHSDVDLINLDLQSENLKFRAVICL